MYGSPEGQDFLLELENDAMSTMPSSSMWTALDDILSTFSSLRTVRFTLSQGESDPLSFATYVKRGLASCRARGLLSFEHVLDGMSESDTGTWSLSLTPFFLQNSRRFIYA
jgi:hypothetical protein